MTVPIILGRGGPNDQQSIELETRKKTRIPNERRQERAPDSMREAVRILTGQFPEARLLSATAVYNCYGLAFASRRTWILDEEDVRRILSDDGFQPLHWDPRIWEAGDIVLYGSEATRSIDHVAVIVEKVWRHDGTVEKVLVVSA